MTKEQDKIIILVTTSSEKEAHSIANLLLKQKKAACVNIIPKRSSFFNWQGKIEKDKETLLLIKSSKPLLPGIIKEVKAKHSYDIPEIIALPIIAGSEDYLKWIDIETTLPQD